MPSTITVTGELGAGVSTTALVFNNVTGINFQIARGVLEITAAGIITNYSLSDIATVTYSISAGSATVIVST